MKVNLSNHIPIEKMSYKNGFGYAMEHIHKSLLDLGYEVGAENADVQIWWDQPHWIEWTPGQYRIAYFPWESTELIEGWEEIVNTADEIWTPSPLIAEWFKTKMELVPPVFVYQHGIDDIWTPKKREVRDTIDFLHLGFESQRKLGPQTMQAFRRAFAARKDVTMTFKTHMPSMRIEYQGKLNVVNKKIDVTELVQMFHDHHVFAFVSGGEGFGFPPLQAMATGMPTIINDAWAPYPEFVDPDLAVSSKLVNSAWGKLHPGQIFRPSMDELVDKMRYAADNYEQVSEFAMSQTSGIAEKYNWLNLTRDVFQALETRLK